MKKMKVGLVGLGEVAQIIHLPILESMADRYEISALCDISPGALRTFGERYRIGRLYENYRELAAQSDLDAVFVLNSDEYHADAAIEALNHKKHVLIEKPMTLNLSDADAIIEARDRNGVQAMVGYMRRFAPAFIEAVDAIKTFDEIRYVKLRDIIGHNHLFTGQTSQVLKFNDIPPGKMEERQARRKRMIGEAIGDVPKNIYNVYGLLAGLNSHDLSAMRELFGMPGRVVSAVQWCGGNYLTVIFDYGSYHAVLETGVDDIRRFDASIEIFGKSKQLTVQYDTPFIRHLPTTLRVKETHDENFTEYVRRPTFKDPYTCELEHFHDAITNGYTVKTTPEDAKDDLVLFRMIVNALLNEIETQSNSRMI